MTRFQPVLEVTVRPRDSDVYDLASLLPGTPSGTIFLVLAARTNKQLALLLHLLAIRALAKPGQGFDQLVLLLEAVTLAPFAEKSCSLIYFKA